MKQLILLSLFVLTGLTGCDRSFTSKEKHYYVDPAEGKDDNKGNSPARPWKSLARLAKTEIKSGDVICLKGGRELKGSLIIKNISSSAQQPLIITSYGNGRAFINAGDSIGILIEKCSNVIVKNIVIAGSGRLTGNTSNGIEFRFIENGYIDSIEVSGFLWSGVRITGGRDISIRNAYAHDNGYSGINAESGKEHIFKTGSEYKTLRNLYIGYCVAENNPGCPLVKNNHSGNGILIGGITGGVIEFCEAMNNGWDMPREGNGPVGIWAYMSDSIIIRQCYSHHNKTSAIGKDGGGFDFDGGVTNSILQYNHSAYNEGGGYGLFQYAGASEWSNNIVRYNTSLNDGSKNGKAGIYVWCDPSAVPMKDCRIYNNIVISNQGHDVMFEPGIYQGLNFENNIFTLTSDSDLFIDGNFKSVTFDNNQYWSFFKSTHKRAQPDVKYDRNPIFSEPSLDLPMMGKGS
jgi:hypothetical protein